MKFLVMKGLPTCYTILRPIILSKAHPTSYPIDTRGSFPGGKEAGA
jgi:hypothetical protein